MKKYDIEYSTQYTPEEADAEATYKITVRHDKIKNRYCKSKNIKLIRIQYWKREDLEYCLFDEFVNLKILEEL